MYFWNINALVKALKEGTMTTRQKGQYKIFFITILLITIASYALVPAFNFYDYVDIGLFIVINVIGIMIVHKINKNGDNKEFVFRYLTLTIPIFIRIIILSSILSILGYVFLVPFLSGLSLEETNMFDLFVNAVTEIILNLLMIKYFKRINS